MSLVTAITALAVYLTGFGSASVIIWRGSSGAAGIMGLAAAIVWPIWLPLFGALRGWRFGK